MKRFLLASLLLVLLAGPAQGQSSPFVVSDLVFSAGALVGESASYRLSGTLGQPFAGRAASSRFIITLGFWAAVPPEAPAPTAIETIDSDGVPEQFLLDQNYPNPFNPATRIRYALPTSEPVRLAIYDMLGREVVVLVDRQQTPGIYEVTFDADGLPSGLYVYRIEAGSSHQSRTMLLLK